MLLIYRYGNTDYFNPPLYPMRYLLNICYEASISKVFYVIIHTASYTIYYLINPTQIILQHSFKNNTFVGFFCVACSN